MKSSRLSVSLVILLVLGGALICGAAASKYHDILKHKPHSMDVKPPDAIQPGPEPAVAPSDAIVIFGRSADGEVVNDLSRFVDAKTGGEPRWTLGDGYFMVKPKTASLRTKREFGSIQLHLEWAAPEVVEDTAQGRGNSGIYIMTKYEVQILDSYNNRTYADGQAASMYGQYPPLVNACRKPGEWQTYDIIFHRPEFDDNGLCVKPATVTVLHNGVLVQDHMAYTGPTGHKVRPPYRPHPDKLPFMLQDHGDLVKFRNIWVRELDG